MDTIRKVGRPRRNVHKRVQVTIYIDLGMLEKVDAMVEKMQEAGDKTASRSELYHQAMEEWLNSQ